MFLADCQARLAFDLISNTWTAVVVWSLRHGPRRPGDLRTEIGGISPKVLTETLRRLESNGLVARRSYAEAPPRVEYELTDLGRTLLGPIGALGELGLRPRRRGPGRPGSTHPRPDAAIERLMPCGRLT